MKYDHFYLLYLCWRINIPNIPTCTYTENNKTFIKYFSFYVR